MGFHEYEDVEWEEAKAPEKVKLANFDKQPAIFNLDFPFFGMSCLKMNARMHQEVLKIFLNVKNQPPWLVTVIEKLIRFYPKQEKVTRLELEGQEYESPKKQNDHSKFYVDQKFQKVFTLKMNETFANELLEEVQQSNSPVMEKLAHHLNEKLKSSPY